MIADLVLLSAAWLGPAAVDEWTPAQPDFVWQFPEDHWSHDGYRTEWWYFTGHLATASGRRFGYQFTFFRVGLLPEAPAGPSQWVAANLIMGHAAIADLDRGEHRFSELLYRETPFLAGFGRHPEKLLVWSRAPAGTDGRWELSFNGEAFDFEALDDTQGMAFSLHTTPVKPRIFQGPGGYSRKGSGPTSASQYYSFTRLQTSGTLTLDGEIHEVTGTSWMDKEFGSNQLEDDQVGWDWFSLQLDDGRELMLYLLRDRDGGVSHASGTLVDANGETTALDPDRWTLEVTRHWTSEESGIRYPAGWTLRLADVGLELEVAPELAAQENCSRLLPGMSYWEGAVKVLVEEECVGRGFVELTGYGEASRPGI